MRVSVERLRTWLLAGAGLVVVTIAASLGYAHFRAHRFLTQLPGKLGVDLRQETDAFTYSQSVKGKTVFTIHAAKAIQRKDGKVTLHNVGIVLYGRTDNRADRIYGNEFEYDQGAGVVRALGEVHLDLEAPAPEDARSKMDYAAGANLHEPDAGSADQRLVHVTTSGLIFLQKLGVASTQENIEFRFRGITGHARGANYSSDTGVTVLQSDVLISGLSQGSPVNLKASRAELDRVHGQVVLDGANAASVGSPGGAETASARRAVLHVRGDGTLDHLDADGDVTLTGEDRRFVAPHATATANASNQIESTRMFGGVSMTSENPESLLTGRAAEGLARFSGQGTLERITLSGDVDLQERSRPGGSQASVSSRRLSARAVDLTFSGAGGARRSVSDAKADGDARVLLVSGERNAASNTSEIGGDSLTASFRTIGGRPGLAHVHGSGRTRLRRVNAAGEEISTGDSIEVEFADPGAPASVSGKSRLSRGDSVLMTTAPSRVKTAVQTGHVVITRFAGSGKVPASEVVANRAVAESASYAGAADTLTLTGNVQMTDGQDAVWADTIELLHGTGDAKADGNVRASYRPRGAAEGAHVLAGRAEFRHDSEQAIFYGLNGARARLWQGGSQVEAPVLELLRPDGVLLAHGREGGGAADVHAVLPSGTGGATANGRAVSRGVMLVESHALRYSDAEKKAEFSGGVLLRDARGTMRSQDAVAYLR